MILFQKGLSPLHLHNRRFSTINIFDTNIIDIYGIIMIESDNIEML